MKKFIVRDEDNKEFSVEELDECSTAATENDDGASESAALSEDEIGALKKLAAVADKLVALATDEGSSELDDEDKDKDKDKDDDDDTDVVDTDEDADEGDEDDKKLRNDSKVAVGAIEKKTKTNDSLNDSQELDIASAWAKRYGGNK